jgi:hypothetical protein
MAEIFGAGLLTSSFGSWPDFHDAEITRLCLERAHPYERGPTLEIDVHTFEITPEVDKGGHYVLRHHVLVTLRFEGVQELVLEDFNNQNAIASLTFAPIDTAAFPEPAFQVSIDGAHGLAGGFRCREVTVIAVRPWEITSEASA